MKTDKDYDAIVLFGGSFDPVQSAHADIVQKLAERFEKVIVVPAGLSPFKKDGAGAGAALRLKMLRKSLPKLKNVTVSEVETEKSGVSYSYDTALYFKEEQPERPLYFAVGSDMLAKLHTWSRFDGLKRLVTFYVIPRPGFAVKNSVVKKLQKLGARLIFADFEGLGDSSAQARLDAAFGKFDLVPPAAAKIIQDEGLYRDFKRIVEAYPAFNLPEERIAHIYHTAVTAIRLAKIHGASAKDAALAALLHDIAKEASEEWLRAQGVPEPAPYMDAPAKVMHAFWGAEAAKSYFGVRKKSVVDAVRFHSTGAPNMSKLAKIIYLADYIEPTRDIECQGLEPIRKLAAKNLNAAMAVATEASIRCVLGKGRTVYPLTLAAFEYYKTQNAKRKTENEGGCSGAKANSELGMRNEGLGTADNKGKTSETIHDSRFTNQLLSSDLSDPESLAYRIAALLDDKKGRDITLVKLAHKTIIADYFVVASAFSTTAVRALTDYVDERLSKDFGVEPLRRDIDPKWAAIDYGSVILHIQLDEVRKFYDLERLWSDGTNVKRI